VDRNYDINTERAEMKKLKKKHKEAERGAARELKKDNAFLYQQKRKKENEESIEREEQRKKFGLCLSMISIILKGKKDFKIIKI